MAIILTINQEKKVQQAGISSNDVSEFARDVNVVMATVEAAENFKKAGLDTGKILDITLYGKSAEAIARAGEIVINLEGIKPVDILTVVKNAESANDVQTKFAPYLKGKQSEVVKMTAGVGTTDELAVTV
jgi:hypothetical protein